MNEQSPDQPYGVPGAMPPPYSPPPYGGSPYGAFPPPLNYPPPVFYPDPAAPFGRHQRTGEPLSDKSKLLAGLLQLLGLIGVLGIGRIYLGYTRLGITELVGCLAFGILTCGFGFIVPVIWGIVDAVLILSDNVRDPYGRPLRDGF